MSEMIEKKKKTNKPELEAFWFEFYDHFETGIKQM